MGAEPGRRVRWRLVARWAVPAAALAVIAAGLMAVGAWVPIFPRALGRRLTEGFLRGLLIGHAGLLLTVGLGAVGLTAAVVRARRRRVERPLAARLLLLCVSGLIGLAGAEAAAAVWLAWDHRLPVLPTRFRAGPSDEASVVVIGESSARGYPYNPALSVGQVVGWQLERALAGRTVAVDVRARLGITLEQAHQDLAGIDRRPDVLIVYSGHNEYQSRYDGQRDAGLSEAPLDPILNRLYGVSLKSPLCRMIYETINRNRLGGPPLAIKEHRLIDPPLCTPSESAAIRDDFRRRLDAIVRWSERIGAVAVLVIPPGNDSGFEPSRTVLPETVGKAERARLTAAFQAARALEDGDPVAARERYRALTAERPEFAEAHFRLARLLDRAGDRAEANRRYALARDCDGLPVRCPSPLQDLYRGVAARHGCILVDGPAVLRAASPRGVLDDHVFHDAHHPSLAGQVALAQAVLDELHDRQALGWTGPKAVVEASACVDRFAVDAAVWARVCAASATFYRDFAPGRFDPSERLAKQKRYEAAGRQIAAGLPPEQTGVPGLGVRAPQP